METLEDRIFEYSLDSYSRSYQGAKERLRAEAISSAKDNRISSAKEREIENFAQLEAIKLTMMSGRLEFPHQIPLLWKSIYRVHLYRKSGISDPEVIDNVLAASQSWKASSGHAFEYMTKELANLALCNTPILFLLQKDICTLLKANEIANEVRDISWLREQVATDNYDLYVIAEKDEKKYCFGCVQCKTSIRDRVSRDRELSSVAMKAYFWSISFVLDGTQLRTPKYTNMVNGGTTTFADNGWHGMYDLSGANPKDRIYTLDLDFSIIRSHALQAFDFWANQRQWFTHEWKAQ